MKKLLEHYKMVKLIEQSCQGCILRIEAWKPMDGEDGFVDVQVISNHGTANHMRLKTRIRNAWRALRGNYDWSGFELFTQDEIESFLNGLSEASRKAFPKFVSETSVMASTQDSVPT